MRGLRNRRYMAVYNAMLKMPTGKRFLTWELRDKLEGKVARRLSNGQIGAYLVMMGVKNLDVNEWMRAEGESWN